MSFWDEAGGKGRFRKKKQPDRLGAQRGELHQPQECPIYGPKDGFDFKAHSLYVQWQEGLIPAQEAQRRLWQLERSYPGRRGT